MAGQKTVPGTCATCREPITKRTASSHLKKNHAEPGGEDRFIILIDTPYSSPYWMLALVKTDAQLSDLDEFIRDTWVECCGHLSAFYISGREFLGSFDGDGDDMEERAESMNIKLSKIVGPGMSFKYEYDFGTPTELRLKVVDTIPWEEEDDLVIMAGMNNKPEAVCTECGKPAVWHYAEWDNEKLLCKTCASDEDLDECYLLPICNSPRSGVCGYEGSHYDIYPDDESDDE